MPLDARDRAILLHLESDSRIPISQLAKKVGLSKDGVAYRIRNMEKEGAIKGFYTVLNIPKLGLVPHKVTIKFQNIEPEKKSEIAEYLKKTGIVGWVVSCDGRWDFMFICWVRSTYEFGRFFSKFLERYGSFVQDRELNILTESHSCKRKYLLPCEPEESVYSGAPAKEMLDEADIRIIRLMADDSRIRIMDIAEEVGMVPESVSQRVKSLVERDIMQKFRPILDAGKLGCQFYNVMVRLNSTKRLGEMFEYLREHPNTVHYSRYSGTFDIGIDVEIDGPEKFREMMNEMKTKFSKEIRGYEPLLVYREHKITYSPF